MWQQWVNGILGLWVVLIPFVGLTPASSSATWTIVITGIIIAIVGFWGALSATPQTR